MADGTEILLHVSPIFNTSHLARACEYVYTEREMAVYVNNSRSNNYNYNYNGNTSVSFSHSYGKVKSPRTPHSKKNNGSKSKKIAGGGTGGEKSNAN